MEDVGQRIEARKGFGILIVILFGTITIAIPVDASIVGLNGIGIAVIVCGVGGMLAGFVGGRSTAARTRYMIAGTVCTIGVQLGYRLMPDVAAMGKYVNVIPALLGGLPGAFVYFITREDAEAADTRWYEERDASAAD